MIGRRVLTERGPGRVVAFHDQGSFGGIGAGDAWWVRLDSGARFICLPSQLTVIDERSASRAA